MNKLKPLFAILSVMIGGSLIGYALAVMAGYFVPVLLVGVFLVLVNILSNPPALIASACAALSGVAFALIDSLLLDMLNAVFVWVGCALLAFAITDQILKKS